MIMYNMGLEIGDFVGVSQPLTSIILNDVVRPNEQTELKLQKLSEICAEVDGYVKGRYLGGNWK